MLADKLIQYTEGCKLRDADYLLKVYENASMNRTIGFMTKYNKDGSIPKAFKDWKNISDIYIISEVFNTRWKYLGYRIGKSQQWAIMQHPFGFELEIYLSNLNNLIQTSVIYNGVLDGAFKWHDKILIRDEPRAEL